MPADKELIGSDPIKLIGVTDHLGLRYYRSTQLKKAIDRVSILHLCTPTQSDGTPEAREGALLDVVFVHGLGGSWKKTWKAKRGRRARGPFYWPTHMAEFDDQLRVWSLDYSAPPSEWFRGVAMSGYDRARNLLDVLEQTLGDKPILFVTHSLGGVLVKKLLVLRRPKASPVVEQTRAVVFLATPHDGSGVARAVRWISALSLPLLISSPLPLRWLLQPTRLINDLEHDNSGLRELRRDYIHTASQRGIITRSYNEEKKLLMTLVVSRSSADPGIGEGPIPVEAHHTGIAKPANPRTRHVVDGINRLARQVIANERRIMWIDDEKLGLQVVKGLDPVLARRVIFCTPPGDQELLEKLLEEQQPDAFVLDYKMEPSGKTIAAWIRAVGVGAPIVFYSQHVEKNVKLDDGESFQTIKKKEDLVTVFEIIDDHLA